MGIGSDLEYEGEAYYDLEGYYFHHPDEHTLKLLMEKHQKSVAKINTKPIPSHRSLEATEQKTLNEWHEWLDKTEG